MRGTNYSVARSRSFLPEHLTAEATQLNRFKSEARTASALNHPNILTVHEIGAEGTRQFIATEFIEGITLRALLARGRMNLHDALEIAVQVASALAAAHETGVVHRDIKPENIMLRPDGYAKRDRFRDCQTHRATAGIGSR